MHLNFMLAALSAITLGACSPSSDTKDAASPAQATVNATKNIALASKDVVQGLSALDAMKAFVQCILTGDASHCSRGSAALWSGALVTEGPGALVTKATCALRTAVPAGQREMLALEAHKDPGRAEELNDRLNALDVQIQNTSKQCHG